VLVLAVVGVVATYVGLRLHERANVVDLEVLPASGAPAGAEPAPVGPRDLPSDEVREQVDFYPRGGPGCAPPDLGGVAISVGFESKATIGLREEFCSEGFISGRPVSVRISGRGFRVVGRWIAPAVWSWNVPPHTLPGRYFVRAVQGDRVATTRIRIVTSPQPFVRVRQFGSRRPATFEIVVAGTTPNQDVPVHLYRAVNPTSGGRDYFSTLTIPTDARGNGSIVVRGTGGSTYTCYGVLPGFKGIAWSEDQFCFGSPDLD
jgi:hypothetical protein